MKSLILSVMQQEIADPNDLLRPLLDQFEERNRIKVELNILSWADGQEELLKTVLYGTGPNVSEVGTSWVSSFLGMNGLLPFTPRELRGVIC